MEYALIVAAIVIWILVGQIIRLVLFRRGHRGTPVLTAALAGPLLALALPRAALSARGAEHARTVAHGESGPGTHTVVVGVDGSPEARDAVRSLLDVVGPRIETMTLATVIGVSYPDAATRQSAEHEARAALASLASEVTAWANAHGYSFAPEQVVLTGEPARELLELAEHREADFLVVGRRGAGVSKLLLGSVATQLASRAPMPVLIAGR